MLATVFYFFTAFALCLLGGLSGIYANVYSHPAGSCRLISQTFVNCSHDFLKTVPNETFPVGTEKLDLSFNKLQKISGFTFSKLQSLKWLDLSHNEIHSLDKFAFASLHKLVYLNINSNDIALSDSTYPSTVFKPLQSLEILHMEDNKCIKLTNKPIFPRAVAVLHNLRELYTDLPTYVTFTKEFANLTQLRKLSSSGSMLPNKRHKNKCCVKRLYNNTFDPFRNIAIQEFRLAYSCLSNVQLNAFEPLNYVKAFEFMGNQELGLYWALQILYGLRNQTIPRLSLRAANSFIRRNKRDFLPNVYSTRFLNTICVESLDISENYIYMSKSAQFSRGDCLRGFNMAVHITDPKLLFMKLLKEKPFPNLHYFNISTGNMNSPNSRGPWTYSDTTASSNTTKKANVTLHLHTSDVSYLPMNCEFYCEEFLTLKVLNISGWNCSIAKPEFFIGLVNVTHFSARRAKLNIGLRHRYSKGSIFRSMVNLEYVDLSENDLTSLPDNLFLTCPKLSSLMLYNNKIMTLPMQVFEKTTLEYLDLSGNVIEYLTATEMKLLESQKKRVPNFKISMASNPFICNCQSLEFLQWLNTTSVVDDFGPDFQCIVKEGKMIAITKFMENFKNFSVSCISHEWLKIGTASILALIILIILLIMYYRHRWNVHYWFYTNCRPSQDMLPRRPYEYDAFVCYNHNDHEWVYRALRPFLEHEERGIRLCLHHRDFEVGEVIHQNIVDAVNNSRKIILVISNQFVRSTWGEYEIEMAGMRSVQEGRTNVIICVLLEEVPVRQMPRSLMNLWHKVTFIVWPESEREQNLFWEKLMSAFK